MRQVLATLVASSVLVVGRTDAQVPLPTKEYVNREYKMAVGFPASWAFSPPVRNEVWLTSGEIRGVKAGCFVRVSVVEGLQLVKPDEYFQQSNADAFVKMASMSAPDVRMHLFDFSYLGGRKARRIIYSGTDAGVKVGNLMHQTLNGNRIVTLTCYTEQKDFQLIYNELDAIAASFRFL